MTRSNEKRRIQMKPKLRMSSLHSMIRLLLGALIHRAIVQDEPPWSCNMMYREGDVRGSDKASHRKVLVLACLL